MDRISVLLAEDEETLAMIIRDTLAPQGFQMVTARNGEEALRLFFDSKPDVLVADVMMPRMDGFELVRRIRQTDSQTPVLFLTARSAVTDVVHGFELGANDYLKKPFGMQELIIRIKALLGRAALNAPVAVSSTQCIDIGRYSFTPKTQQLLYLSEVQELSHRESELLRRLAENSNHVVETQTILLELWGDDSFFNTRSLQVFITKLRHRLSKDPNVRIVNVRGLGYKLIC